MTASEAVGGGVLLHLASRSPRRRLLLEAAGIPFRVIDAAVDDAELTPGRVSPASWAMSLAHLKARAGLAAARPPGGLVLGADTVCVTDDGWVLGQPADASEAAAMIRRFAGGRHDVISGVCLLDGQGRRELFAVRARVTLGELPPETIEAYAAGGDWRGKAGGYNYFERAEAGWPLACEGDVTAVVGLPMTELKRRLGIAEAER